jgi:hypothetical protein
MKVLIHNWKTKKLHNALSNVQFYSKIINPNKVELSKKIFIYNSGIKWKYFKTTS